MPKPLGCTLQAFTMCLWHMHTCTRVCQTTLQLTRARLNGYKTIYTAGLAQLHEKSCQLHRGIGACVSWYCTANDTVGHCFWVQLAIGVSPQNTSSLSPSLMPCRSRGMKSGVVGPSRNNECCECECQRDQWWEVSNVICWPHNIFQFPPWTTWPGDGMSLPCHWPQVQSSNM